MEQPTSQPERVPIRRLGELAITELEHMLALLDRAQLCHVGIVEDDRPVVIPTLYARVGHDLVLHGSVASRLLRNLRDGSEVCVTVTELDGLVLARSAFETSMNYRSVVLWGTARELSDADERLEALRAISEAVLPGRWADVRAPSETELRQTLVVALRIERWSAKVSDGHPEDPADDLDLPVWAGVVPLRRTAGTPEPAPDLSSGIEVPSYLSEWVQAHR